MGVSAVHPSKDPFMPASDLNAKLQEAISLAQMGQRTEARTLLEAVVSADPSQELAWLWLATVSTNREERIGFLERALALNPNNTTAQQAYLRLTGQAYEPPPQAAEAAARPPEPPISMRTFLMLMGAAALVVVVIVAVLNLRGESKDGNRSEPAVEFILPTSTLPPTSPYSPTPPATPHPTNTPGPSPTPVWLAPPATWTPRPSPTTVPTRRPPPTWTPLPSITPTPTARPDTATFTPLPPTEMPTSSRTPDPHTATARAAQTGTAQFAKTSDAPRTPTPTP